MRVVLYAHDMEPITILNLSDWAYRHLEQHRQVVLPVMKPMSVLAMPELSPAAEFFRKVEITAEPLHRNGEKHLMLFTRDEEQALLLKAAFLPGQQWVLRDIRRDEFAKGFLAAFDMLS